MTTDKLQSQIPTFIELTRIKQQEAVNIGTKTCKGQTRDRNSDEQCSKTDNKSDERRRNQNKA